jgi:hypothetical protein
MKNKWLIVMGIGFVIFIVLLLLANDSSRNQDSLFDEDVRTVIYNLENNHYQGDIRASINHEEIKVIKNNQEYLIDLPSDLFYIAFAPYINETHDCFNHNLTGCLGEIINQDIEVTVYNEDEDIIETKIMNTGQDGFIGLYLSSETNYRVNVQFNDMESSFITNLYQTCYTEVKLS